MKEDYLWDKTGSDAEIEKLENALKMFRQHEIAAPQLPAGTFVLKTEANRERSSRRLFSFGMVSFACLALAVFSFGVFRLLSFDNNEMAESTQVGSSANPDVSKPQPVVERGSDRNDIRISQVKLPTQPATLKSKRIVGYRIASNVKRPVPRRAVRRRELTPKTEPLVLTVEEKYAYDQLMLALNITSTNLKLVKDKVQGD